MRAAFRVGVAAAAILVGGCRQSEEQVLSELRHQMLRSCSDQTAAIGAQNPAFDTQKFCGCLTDKAIAGRSAAEVRQLFQDKEKMRAAARQASAECRPADAPDLPPLELDEPSAAVPENKQKGSERPRRPEPADRPTAGPTRPPSEGPIATPRPMPVPPAERPAPVPPGFGDQPPRSNAQAPRGATV